jgi:hypothetical protein
MDYHLPGKIMNPQAVLPVFDAAVKVQPDGPSASVRPQVAYLLHEY